MLHIRCGDDILAKLKQAGLPGETIRWADALCQGPTPAGLGPDAWRAMRADFISTRYGGTIEAAERFLADQDRNLEKSGDHDEVLLWFEHDLFDQTVLIYLLNWFAGRQPKQFWLICPDRHIGNMDIRQLAALYPSRQAVTSDQIDLACRAWAAFCEPDPRSLMELMRADTSPLPFLKPALLRHLQEYPSTRNGLSRTEQTALEIVASGIGEPVPLFREVQEREEAFWLGDKMFWPYLDDLSRGDTPLLRIEGTGAWPSREHPSSDRRVSITDIGRRVLAGEEDRLRVQRLDRWLGGVHLNGAQVPWRWDSDRGVVRRPS